MRYHVSTCGRMAVGPQVRFGMFADRLPGFELPMTDLAVLLGYPEPSMRHYVGTCGRRAVGPQVRFSMFADRVAGIRAAVTDVHREAIGHHVICNAW